jgi:hypothetical protein
MVGEKALLVIVGSLGDCGTERKEEEEKEKEEKNVGEKCGETEVREVAFKEQGKKTFNSVAKKTPTAHILPQQGKTRRQRHASEGR